MTSTGVRTLLAAALTGLVSTGLAVTTPAAHASGSSPSNAQEDHRPRRMVPHVVKPGETVTGLAVRHHAWTAEIISRNHLSPSGRLYAGERIVIPVVVDAAPKARASRRSGSTASTPKVTAKTWRHADPSRAAVRSAVIHSARSHGVDPELALAVSWQESGWQMHHVSHASAIGAMQVLPGTGSWMSLYAGRPLELTRLGDNVEAGVLLLSFLGHNTGSTRHQLAAYYQGLGAVREHGLYGETEKYVDNVLAIKRQLERGWNPA